MKALGITSTAFLSVLLAVAAPAWAQEQHEQEQKEKPAQQEEQKAQPQKSAKPATQKAQPEKAAKPAEKPAAQQEKNAKQPEKNVKPEEKNAPQHTMQAQPEKQAQKAGGGRIPNERFKANFGEQHRFHVSQGDYRNHRFQYGGYSFGFVDPWPSNWLYTQDVYVVEIDGVYYLCNPMYPGVNIALNIIL
jgi:flagellar motor protein MotB